jgi:hypothetical protein
MVDALRQARGIVKPSGCVVDLHPTADPALILIGESVAGTVDAGNAPIRHQAATDAIAAAVREGLFAAVDSTAFDFSAYAGSLDDLQAHILEDWCEGRIGDETLGHARRLLPAAPESMPRVRERVAVTLLRPR